MVVRLRDQKRPVGTVDRAIMATMLFTVKCAGGEQFFVSNGAGGQWALSGRPRSRRRSDIVKTVDVAHRAARGGVR